VVDPVIRELHVFPDPEACCAALASFLVGELRLVVGGGRHAAVAISGGSTPLPLFRRLGSDYREALPWSQVELYWTDERAVGPDAPESNFGAARRPLLEPLAFPDANLHRISGERRPLAEAAERYEAELRRRCPAADGDGPATLPLFDHALLGVGPDGHTASLFAPPFPEPEAGRWVVATPPAPVPPQLERVSLTFEALARAEEVILLVCGEEKRPVVQRIFGAQEEGAPLLPAARVRARRRVRWFLDAAAAGPLTAEAAG
jgi:6-phosphogluconolactonase